MKFRSMIVGMIAMLSMGCSATVGVSYVPTSTLKGDGELSLNAFEYLPFAHGMAKANEIPNNAIGSTYLKKDISSFFTDAVRGELEMTGYSVATATPLLIEGRIERLHADALGYSVTWEMVVLFRVSRDGQEVYSKKVSSQNTTPKEVSAYSSGVTVVVREVIEKFLMDAQNSGVI